MKLRGLFIAVLCLVLALSSSADAVRIGTVSGGAPTGAAGGDLGGTYPNPTVTSGAHIGAGTLVNNAVSGWPLTSWADYFNGLGTNTGITANVTQATGINFPGPITFSNICIFIGGTDVSNNYDWGFYNTAGNLVADVGPVHITATGTYCKPTVQGAVTMNGGRAIFAVTASNIAAHFLYAGSNYCWYASTSLGGTSGGQLNSTITFPAANTGANCFGYMVYN